MVVGTILAMMTILKLLFESRDTCSKMANGDSELLFESPEEAKHMLENSKWGLSALEIKDQFQTLPCHMVN
jgi:hypothetical protein